MKPHVSRICSKAAAVLLSVSLLAITASADLPNDIGDDEYITTSVDQEQSDISQFNGSLFAAGDPVEINIANPDANGTGYSYSSGVVTLTENDASYIIKGTTTSNRIAVQSGITVNVTLSDVNITATSGSPFLITPASPESPTTVNLYLEDENILDASGVTNYAGLQVANGAAVTINGSGYLTAKGGRYGAGIGGGDTSAGGQIALVGGTIKLAQGGEYAAGIGGGRMGAGGKITINEGIIESAQGGNYGAGIGSGFYATDGQIITISGGIIELAKGGTNGAGIGGGDYSTGGQIIINGGIIELAQSTSGGAGIGGGSIGTGGTIMISSGTVYALGGNNGAGIGGGNQGAGGTITISGDADVTARCNGICAAGIGGGWQAEGGSITINGGTVDAMSSSGGAGIGGGSSHRNIQGNGGTILITGGDITATGTGGGAGIGGGDDGHNQGSYDSTWIGGSGGDITISGGIVTADGSDGGSGIGGGRGGAGGTIVITDNSVINSAQGGNDGAGIGGGYKGGGGTITISGGTVTAQGGNNGAGIGIGCDGVVGNISISSYATIRAYARNNYAIHANSADGTDAYIVNAYYTNNETIDTFYWLSLTEDVKIICDVENVVLPARYTSYAYNAPAGDYKHSFVADDHMEYSLVQLDNTMAVAASQKTEKTPLKQGEYVTISFLPNGGALTQGSVGNLDTIRHLKYTVFNNPGIVLERFGYKFGGWYDNQDFNGEPYVFGKEMTEDLTLCAKWIKQHTVSFNSNGGTSVDSQIVDDGNTASRPNTPSRSGYSFAGWTLNGRMYNFNDPVASDIILVAQWNEIYIDDNTSSPEAITSSPVTENRTTVSTASTTAATIATTSESSANTSEITISKDSELTSETPASEESGQTITTAETVETSPHEETVTTVEITTTESTTSQTSTTVSYVEAVREAPENIPSLQDISEGDRIPLNSSFPEGYVAVQYDEHTFIIYDNSGVPLGYLTVPEGMTLDEMTFDDMIPLEMLNLPATGGMTALAVGIYGTLMLILGVILTRSKKKIKDK